MQYLDMNKKQEPNLKCRVVKIAYAKIHQVNQYFLSVHLSGIETCKIFQAFMHAHFSLLILIEYQLVPKNI